MTLSAKRWSPRFSANLGFLWSDRPLAERITRAADAGFDAVECHFPYDTRPEEVRAELARTKLPMLCLNTRPGDAGSGEFGLAALPGAEARARAAIDEAISYAAEIGCPQVHVMAGRSDGLDGAGDVLRANLDHASRRGSAAGVAILLEAINRTDVPGYHWQGTDHVARAIRDGGWPNVRILLDCYHVLMDQGEPAEVYAAHAPLVAHVQFAGYPGRREPDGGADIGAILSGISNLGYQGWFGAEYRPSGPVEAGLGWLSRWRGSLGRQNL